MTRLAARYPRVWHVIEADGAAASPGCLRPASEFYGSGTNRDRYVTVELKGGGVAVLRPQLMSDHRLLPTLTGAFAGRADLWRRLIDSHVFFWATAARRDRFVAANRRLRTREDPAALPPVVLEFDTAALLACHAAIAFYATINTGSTVRGGAWVQRDENTFHAIAGYRSGPVAELAIRGRVSLDGLAVGRT
ncbi:MAG TPA: hypothetical protein VFL55_09915 [Acetobacteraceae bacterium]|nr:hypothetical protein [Acetobacteraceae bacterium]